MINTEILDITTYSYISKVEGKLMTIVPYNKGRKVKMKNHTELLMSPKERSSDIKSEQKNGLECKSNKSDKYNLYQQLH